MLKIYTEIPVWAESKYIDDVENDFEIMMMCEGLHDDKLTLDILKSTDNVEFVDSTTVRCSDGHLLSLDVLSISCKYLLLAAYFPDYIINYIEASNRTINKTIELSRNTNMQVYMGLHNVAFKITEDTVLLDGEQVTIKELDHRING